MGAPTVLARGDDPPDPPGAGEAPGGKPSGPPPRL